MTPPPTATIFVPYHALDAAIAETALGQWIDVPYDPAHFAASPGMTWSVQAADVITYAYTVIGKTLFLNLYLDFTAISGTPGPKLYAALPGGFQAARAAQFLALAYDNGWAVTQFMVRLPSDPDYIGDYVELARLDGANWTLTPNLAFVRANLWVSVA